jgi:hypothetical protein
VGRGSESIDEQIYELALKKERLIDTMMAALKCVSINCVSNQQEALDCVVCENEGATLYDENNPAEIPKSNPCLRGLAQRTD